MKNQLFFDDRDTYIFINMIEHTEYKYWGKAEETVQQARRQAKATVYGK